jgi:hypothetical protein
MAKRQLSEASSGDPSNAEPVIIPLPTAQNLAPVAVPVATLSPVNETCLAWMLRDCRELLLQIQQKQGDGKVVVHLDVAGGSATRKSRAYNEHDYRL